MAEVRDYISLNEEGGSINISEEVITVIVVSAVSEIEGVAGMTGALGKDMSELLGKKAMTKGVRITIEDDGIIADIGIMVKFGCKINKVAEDVQNSVSGTVEAMTGVAVKQVNVHVCGVTMNK